MGKFEKVEEWIAVLFFIIIATIGGTGILFYLNVVGAFLVKTLWGPLLYVLWGVSCIVLFLFFKFTVDGQEEIEKLKEEVKQLKEDLETEAIVRETSDHEQKSEIQRISKNSDFLHKQTQELRGVTGLDIKKIEQDAEKAILRSVE